MKRTKLFIALLAVVSLGQSVQAEDTIIDCASIFPEYTGKLFKDIHDSSKHVAGGFCVSLLSKKLFDEPGESDISSSFANHARLSKSILESKGLFELSGFENQVSGMTFTLENYSELGMLPIFKADPDPDEDFSLGYFEPIAIPKGSSTAIPRFKIPETDAICNGLLNTEGANCLEIFNDFAGAFNPYKLPYNKYTLAKNTVLLERLSNDWDRFLEVSKSQTALEVYLTTAFQRGHFKKDRLVGPPKYQVIALHPHIVYDSLGEAEGGERAEIGVALEWIGINFWDWRFPFGLSFARLYVDRSSADRYSNGVMFHFGNKYSIGFADNDGDTSTFVTLDLLKLLEDKKSNLEQYLSRAE